MTALEEIIELSTLYRNRRIDAEITAGEFAEAQGISHKRAASALNGLAEMGRLETELVLNDGSVTRVWWTVDA